MFGVTPMCLLNRNIHSLYCGSAVHQVRRIFKAVPRCLNIASFSPLMYLPCKQQQFVQKYNQRWAVHRSLSRKVWTGFGAFCCLEVSSGWESRETNGF